MIFFSIIDDYSIYSHMRIGNKMYFKKERPKPGSKAYARAFEIQPLKRANR
jgi:hypothetical protein